MTNNYKRAYNDYHDNQEYKAYKQRLRQLEREENLQRRESLRREKQRLEARSRTVGRIRSNTRSTFGSMSLSRLSSRFVSGVSTGNFWTSIVCFIVIFCLMSQLFFNKNIDWENGIFYATILDDNVSDVSPFDTSEEGAFLLFDENGFLSDKAVKYLISPYTFFEGKLTVLKDYTTTGNDTVLWAISNYSSIIERFGEKTSDGEFVLKLFISDSGSVSAIGFMAYVEAVLNRISTLVKNFFNFFLLIGNTLLLLLAFVYTAFNYLVMILTLIGLV